MQIETTYTTVLIAPFQFYWMGGERLYPTVILVVGVKRNFTVPILEIELRLYNSLSICFILVSFLAYSSTLKMEATCSSEMCVDYQQTTRRYVQEDRILHNHRCENVKSNEECYLLTYLLTYSWSWALLEKLPIVLLLKNFPEFYGTRRFITAFTRALHWSLSWARSIQSPPSYPISLRSILILSTHLRLGLPSGLFPSGFPPMKNVISLIDQFMWKYWLYLLWICH
jgi:hypothetical protein